MNEKEKIAIRAAEEISPDSIINLGIGIPTLVANFLDNNKYNIHTENGMIGVTSVSKENVDPNVVNAGKIPVGEGNGSAYFDSATSFGMIRGGHIDIAILGALQIDSKGRVANWSIPGKNIIGVGGAMDLMVGAKKIIITTRHLSKEGTSKLVKNCTYPITSTRCADIIITDLAVFEWQETSYQLVELMGSTSIEEVKKNTDMSYSIHPMLLQKEA